MSQEEMAVKLAEVDARSRSNTHRIDDLSGKVEVLTRLTTAVEVIAREQKHQNEALDGIKTDIDNLGEKVDAIEKKPGKRWEGVVDKLIYGIAGGVATALVGALIYIIGVAP